MNRLVHVIGLVITISLSIVEVTAQEKEPTKATAPKEQTNPPRVFGQSYSTLRPQQMRLVDDYVRRYNATTGSKVTPEQAYDGARMSLRTTFDAVTHALLTTKMSNDNGQNLGRAIDLVDALDDVAGQERGVEGDRQFRLYVNLKPEAFDTLASSREFYRDKDNTVYHKGFPLCFRLKKGPPSIQVSMSRDMRAADIDVDYRSSKFPKALFNGHLTAANSDVRAGNNLETHDNRWTGLNGWWRELFGFRLSGKATPSDEASTGRARTIPLNPRVKADQGIDAVAHDFLKLWVVDKESNSAAAYLSRRSYPCIERAAPRGPESIAPGMVRIHTLMAMDKFTTTTGSVASVGDVFEAAGSWSPELRDAKNAYPAEFRLVGVPADMAQDEECVRTSSSEESGKKSEEKFYATAFRGKRGDSRDKVMSLLWAKEGKYWKIIAIRVDESGTADIIPNKTAATPPVSKAAPAEVTGDLNAVRDITNFYESWLEKRDTASAARYASERSYACIAAPSSAAEKKMKPSARIRNGLATPLPRIPKGLTLADMMSSVQPVNELVRPVEQKESQAFAVMAVPDQMADSFLCQRRHLSEKTPVLNPHDAKYGAYYLSASRLNYGEEKSPALLLLWTREKDKWKIIAWAVEVP